jgi:ribosomal protein L20
MSNKTGVIEKREHQRFKVKEGTFAEFHKPRLFKLGKSRIIASVPIVDISYKGLAFQYTDRNMWSHNFNELSISRIADEIKIDKVPYKAVSDFIKSDFAKDIVLRRCSTKFGELTPAQISQFDHFIQYYTTGSDQRSGLDRRSPQGFRSIVGMDRRRSFRNI